MNRRHLSCSFLSNTDVNFIFSFVFSCSSRDHSCSRGERLEDCILLLLWGLWGLRLHRQPPSYHSPQIHAALQNHAQCVSVKAHTHAGSRNTPLYTSLWYYQFPLASGNYLHFLQSCQNHVSFPCSSFFIFFILFDISCFSGQMMCRLSSAASLPCGMQADRYHSSFLRVSVLTLTKRIWPWSPNKLPVILSADTSDWQMSVRNGF